MKEMMIRLPMVTAASYEDLNQARIYPKTGRYIVKMDNGDGSIALSRKAARSTDEAVQSWASCFVGQPELRDPDEWVLATDLENAKNDAIAAVTNIRCEMENMKSAHQDELADKERDCQRIIDAAQDEAKAVKDCLAEREAKLNDEYEQKYQLRKLELEQEYERKRHQLELDIPKRFGQGEWVSGKTLVEIVKALAAENKQD